MKHKYLLFTLLLLALASVLLVACGLMQEPVLDGVGFADGPYTVTYGEALPEMKIDESTLPGDVLLKHYEYYQDGIKISRREIKDAGVYTVRAVLEDTLAPEKPLFIDTTLTVLKAPIDVSGVVFEGKEQYYNGSNVVLWATEVPAGVTVSYTVNGEPGNRASAIGVHTVEAMLAPKDPTNYYLTGGTLRTAVINIKDDDDHDMSGIGFVGGPYTATYGEALPVMKINEADLPEGVTVGYQFFSNGNRIGLEWIKNAGTYTVKAVFTNKAANFKTPDPIETTLTIEKAKFDVNRFTLEDATAIYNGSAHTIKAGGFSEYATVSYEITKGGSVVTEAVNAGRYTVTATFTLTSDNYEFLNGEDSLAATLVIAPKTVDVSGVVFDDKAEYYTGEAISHGLTLGADLSDKVDVTYTIGGVPGNSATAIGTYEIVATLSPVNGNYVLSGNTTLAATLAIKDGEDHDMSGIGFVDGPYTVTYGDTLPEMKINVGDLPEGVELVGYKYYLGNNEITLADIKNVGTYTVKAIFENTLDNYKTPAPIETTLVIETVKIDVNDFTFVGGTVTYNGKNQIIAASGYEKYATVAYDITEAINAGRYTVTATFALIDDENYEFLNGEDSLTATLVIDPKPVDVSGIVFGNKEAYYTGSSISHGLTLGADLSDKVVVTYTIGGVPGNSATAIGAYELVATLAPANGNYVLSGETTLAVTLTIKDLEDHDMSGIGFVGGPYTATYGDTLPEMKIDVDALPEGVELVEYKYYLGNNEITLADIKNVGTYTVKAIFKNTLDNYKTPAPIETTLVIETVKVNVDSFAFVGGTVTYNGKNQIITASDYEKYATVAYDITEAINAGTYRVTATFTLIDDENYEFVDGKSTREATLVIETVKVNVDSFAFVGGTVTYNGKNQIITASDYEKYATVAYDITEAINAGTYRVTATFTLIDSVNYEFKDGKRTREATLVIDPKPVDVSGVIFENKTAFYYEDKDTYTHEVSNLPEGVTVTYTIDGEPGNTATAIGEYKIVATLAPANGNYVLSGNTTLGPVSFVVRDGLEHEDMGGIGFADGPYTVTYGDAIPEMKINEADLPKGEGWAVTVKYEYYLGETRIALEDIKNAGTYTVKAVFTTNRENYKHPKTIETTLVIEQAEVDVTNSELFTFVGGTKTYTGAAQSLEVTKYPSYVAVTHSGEGINAGRYTVTATFTITDANYKFKDGKNTLTATLVIDPKPVDVSGVVFGDKAVYYTGSSISHGLTLGADLSDKVSVTYTIGGVAGNSATAIGTYEIVATLAPANGNYVLSGNTTLPATLTIKDHEEHNMSGIGFVGGPYTVTYGDTLPEMKINADALPEGVELVEYKYYLGSNEITLADIKNVGTYTIKAIFKNTLENYKTPVSIDTTLVIETVKVNVNDFTFVGGTKTYTGAAQSLTVTEYPEDLVEIVGYAIKGGGEAINVGEYTVVVTFKLLDETNYEFENGSTLEAKLNITKAKVNVDSALFTFVGGTKTYTGAAQSLTVTEYPTDLVEIVGYAIKDGEAINVGEYTVVVTFKLLDETNYEFEGNKSTLEAKLTITPQVVNVSGIVFGNKEVYYTGSSISHGLTLGADLSDKVSVTYTIGGVTGNSATAIGTYEIVATLAPANGNYVLSGNTTLPATLTIKDHAEHNMSGIGFVDGPYTATYGDTLPEMKINADALPEGVELVEYKYYLGSNEITLADIKNVGTYTIKAIFKNTLENYKTPAPIETTLVIGQAEVDVDDFIFENRTETYTGETFTITASGLPAYVTVEYTTTKGDAAVDAINAGTYKVTATFTITDENYKFANGKSTRTADLLIRKAEVDVDAFTFVGGTYIYTGETFAATVSGNPAYVTVEYTTTKGDAVVDAINVGTYTVTATFTITDGNYMFKGDKNTRTATIVIEQAEVTYAELQLAWNYANMAGYDAATNAIRVAYGAGFSYEMTLDDASLAALAEKGITVSYATVKATNSGTVSVTAPITLRGVYATTATFTAEGNYKIADGEPAFAIDWTICSNEDGSWTPIVRPE